MHENNALNRGIEFRPIEFKGKDRGNTPQAVKTEKTPAPLLAGNMALRSTQF